MIVFLVTTGQYADYEVHGVFDSEYKAQAVADAYRDLAARNYVDIDPRVLNEVDDLRGRISINFEEEV